ncbi:hypothetical protein P4361_15820, partial [Fictibacillus sp. B-59209]|nr:hypothetical protein [Fictibacillus sp. B-59209]
GETPAGACTKRLTARPAESEQPGTEINSLQTTWTAPSDFQKAVQSHPTKTTKWTNRVFFEKNSNEKLGISFKL